MIQCGMFMLGSIQSATDLVHGPSMVDAECGPRFATQDGLEVGARLRAYADKSGLDATSELEVIKRRVMMRYGIV